MSGPLLHPLSCPKCGRDAEGSGASQIYLCPPCGTARHMARPGEPYPFRYLRAAQPGRPELYAPFWRLEGTASLRSEDPGKALAYRNMRPLGPLFFPAFWTLKAMHHENLTQRYALMESPPGPDPEASGPVLPGVVDPAHLPAMARLTWLAYLDRVSDVTGVDVVYLPRAISYAAVPFFRAGGGWQDGLLGLPFPGAYFAAAHP